MCMYLFHCPDAPSIIDTCAGAAISVSTWQRGDDFTVWNGDLTGFTCLHLSFLGETISWIMVAKSAWPRHGDIGWYWCSHVFTVFARLSEFGLIHPHCGQSSMNNPYGSSRTFWGSIWAMMWGFAVLFSGSVWIHRKDTIFNAVYKVYI